MYKNLIANANYKNILQPDIYFNYEDFQARMIEPLRSTFNSLSIALLNDGKEKEALDVLRYAMQTLYAPHMQPSLANLQLAEILLNLNQKAWSEKLTSAVFDSSFLLVKEDISKGRNAEALSLYLLRKSAELLGRTGHSAYIEKVNDLKLFR